MDGLLVVIVLIIVVIGGLLLFTNLFDFQSKDKPAAVIPESAETESETLETTRWQSVRISPGTNRCEYASILSGKVFLLKEAPPLPLVNCGEANCSCRYIHLDDRRSGADRRTGPIDPGYQPAAARSDRRRRSGRRAADVVA